MYPGGEWLPEKRLPSQTQSTPRASRVATWVR